MTVLRQYGSAFLFDTAKYTQVSRNAWTIVRKSFRKIRLSFPIKKQCCDMVDEPDVNLRD